MKLPKVWVISSSGNSLLVTPSAKPLQIPSNRKKQKKNKMGIKLKHINRTEIEWVI